MRARERKRKGAQYSHRVATSFLAAKRFESHWSSSACEFKVPLSDWVTLPACLPACSVLYVKHVCNRSTDAVVVVAAALPWFIFKKQYALKMPLSNLRQATSCSPPSKRKHTPTHTHNYNNNEKNAQSTKEKTHCAQQQQNRSTTTTTITITGLGQRVKCVCVCIGVYVCVLGPSIKSKTKQNPTKQEKPLK